MSKILSSRPVISKEEAAMWAANMAQGHEDDRCGCGCEDGQGIDELNAALSLGRLKERLDNWMSTLLFTAADDSEQRVKDFLAGNPEIFDYAVVVKDRVHDTLIDICVKFKDGVDFVYIPLWIARKGVEFENEGLDLEAELTAAMECDIPLNVESEDEFHRTIRAEVTAQVMQELTTQWIDETERLSSQLDEFVTQQIQQHLKLKQPPLHLILEGLEVASIIVNAVPSRAQDSKDPTMAYIGELVNVKCGHVNGYRAVEDALFAMKSYMETFPEPMDEELVDEPGCEPDCDEA